MANKPERGSETVRTLFFDGKRHSVGTDPTDDRLQTVVDSKVLGFREILGVVVYARHLDPDFDPRTELYSSNPRSLYEKDMKPVLDELGIKAGQSGPLNIAKATQGLNDAWAAQRRPKATAETVLSLIDDIMNFHDEQLREFASRLGNALLDEAVEIAATRNELDPNSSAFSLSQVSRSLIEMFPLGGAMPLVICGLCLELEFPESSGIFVEGTLDSVFSTNKTSKKVGDLTAGTEDEAEFRIYEVTVKSFGEQRISECVQSLLSYFDGNLPDDLTVQVLCRPDDVPDFAKVDGTELLQGEVQTAGVAFEFMHIFEWISGKLAEASQTKRTDFFESLQEYLNSTRVPTEVRRFWASTFGG